MRNPIRSLAQRVARSILNQAIGSSRELADYLNRYETETEAGVDINQDTAMRLSTVYSCVRVLSEDIAKLPLVVYQRQPKGKQLATDFWLNDLIQQPNPWQTGFEFREMQQAYLELYGNFYAIKTVVRGETRELLPVPPSRLKIELTADWKLKYTLTMPDGAQSVVPNELMYHQRGLTLNSFLGLSPLSYQRETMAFGIALRQYGSKLFRNGANVSGVLKHPGELSEPAWQRLKESFEEKYAGLGNAGKVLLLEEGTDFVVTGMKADDAQFLESRKFSRSEICAIYRVPPHMIADLERATFSNIEQQSLDYVQNGLMGRVTRNEQRMQMSLLSPAERKTYFVKHDLDGLLRGDFETRMRGYQTAVLTGWITRNEVREAEDMNPGPADLDEYLVPSNEMLSKSMEENDKARQNQLANPTPPPGSGDPKSPRQDEAT
jgi:HK97 family phage portal protein